MPARGKRCAAANHRAEGGPPTTPHPLWERRPRRDRRALEPPIPSNRPRPSSHTAPAVGAAPSPRSSDVGTTHPIEPGAALPPYRIRCGRGALAAIVGRFRPARCRWPPVPLNSNPGDTTQHAVFVQYIGIGAPKTNRTSDLPLRRGLLYPLSYRGVARILPNLEGFDERGLRTWRLPPAPHLLPAQNSSAAVPLRIERTPDARTTTRSTGRPACVSNTRARCRLPFLFCRSGSCHAPATACRADRLNNRRPAGWRRCSLRRRPPAHKPSSRPSCDRRLRLFRLRPARSGRWPCISRFSRLS